jgi:hypothetical protein
MHYIFILRHPYECHHQNHYHHFVNKILVDVCCSSNCYLNHLLKKIYLKEEIKIQDRDDAFKLHTSVRIDNLLWPLQAYAGTLVIQPYT